jgi:hypothetical protein
MHGTHKVVSEFSLLRSASLLTSAPEDMIRTILRTIDSVTYQVVPMAF